MSMYFDINDETLWNPSNGAGRLPKQVEVFEKELKLPSGIGQGKYWATRTHLRSITASASSARWGG
jgi:hypothetical protein